MRACGRHEAQDAEVERRSLGRDQGGETGIPYPVRWVHRSTVSRCSDDCVGRGRCALYSYERHGRPIPYTGVDGSALAIPSKLLADAGTPVTRFTAVVRERQNSKCTFPR